MDWRMQLDDLLDVAHAVPEPVHERRVFAQERAEGLRVVVVQEA